MGLGEFWGQTELNPHIYHLLTCLAWGLLVWNCASVSFFVKWDKTACLEFIMRMKGDHYIPLTSPWTWHSVNCQYTWHYDQASQPSKRRWLRESPTVIPSYKTEETDLESDLPEVTQKTVTEPGWNWTTLLWVQRSLPPASPQCFPFLKS